MQEWKYFISIYKTEYDKYGFIFFEGETYRIIDRSLTNEHFDDDIDLIFWLEESRIGKYLPLVPLPEGMMFP